MKKKRSGGAEWKKGQEKEDNCGINRRMLSVTRVRFATSGPYGLGLFYKSAQMVLSTFHLFALSFLFILLTAVSFIYQYPRT